MMRAMSLTQWLIQNGQQISKNKSDIFFNFIFHSWLVFPPYPRKIKCNDQICTMAYGETNIFHMEHENAEPCLRYMLLHQPYFSWNSLGSWGYIFLMETKRNEKCGWGCFFQGPWRVCKWSETLRVASGWAWVWIRTLHLGHMCRQQGQKDGDIEPKPLSLCVCVCLFFLCLN